MPGEEVATSEEYLPGPGTYERDGRIIAAVLGHLQIDEKEKVARVKCPNEPVVLKDGDIVLGEVVQVSKSMAMVKVLCVEGVDRPPGGDTEGPIHVSRISRRFCDDARAEFKAGDMVRARVVQAEPALQLGTDDDKLGALRARCVECRRTLVKKAEVLYCTECETVERRKLASDFASYTPDYESNKNQ